MTQERFLHIVDDPDLLRTITYEELKTLALAYPYAHNLRYLLAIKARQIDHQDVLKNVSTAAAYSLDRTQLFRLVAPQMLVPQEVWADEEVLELKPIETLKRKLEDELNPVNREAPTMVTAEKEAALSHVPEKTMDEQIPVASVQTEVIAEIYLPRISYQSFETWIGHFSTQVLAAPDIVLTKSEQVSSVQEPENAIQESDFQPVEIDDEDNRAAPKTLGIAQVLAEKSVAENKDVISETLAKLYAKQGYRDKAITMYERLSLAFPEKSTYFAAEIDKLKK